VLYHAAIFLRRRQKLPGLKDVMGAWLLHIDILAGLAAPDGLQGMIMVWRGDRNGVDGLVLQQLPKIGESRGPLVRQFLRVI
jgi:hypothetical protein